MKYLYSKKYEHYPSSYPDPHDWLDEPPLGDDVVVLEEKVYKSFRRDTDKYGILSIQTTNALLFRHRFNDEVSHSDLAKWLANPKVYVAIRAEDIKPPVNKGRGQCRRHPQ